MMRCCTDDDSRRIFLKCLPKITLKKYPAFFEMISGQLKREEESTFVDPPSGHVMLPTDTSFFDDIGPALFSMPPFRCHRGYFQRSILSTQHPESTKPIRKHGSIPYRFVVAPANITFIQPYLRAARKVSRAHHFINEIA